MNKIIFIITIIFTFMIAYRIFITIRNKYVFKMRAKGNNFCHEKTMYCIEYIHSHTYIPYIEDDLFYEKTNKLLALLALYNKVDNIRKIYNEYAPSYKKLIYQHISFNYEKLHKECIEKVNQYVSNLIAEVDSICNDTNKQS